MNSNQNSNTTNNDTIKVSSITDKNLQKKDPKKYYVKFSFMITYILLLTTGTLTLIESLRTNIPFARHVLNLETCISLVAGYFYSLFLAQISESEKTNGDVDWSDITKTRYVDWSITTPLMLLVLCIVLSYHSKIRIHLSTYLLIIFLNYTMLFIGYLGEFDIIDRLLSMVLGFIPFFIMFYIIYIRFVKPKYHFANYVLFSLYIVVWGLYGIVFMLDEYMKNISMNILDCIAKCLIGNGLFVYYAHILVL